MLNKYEPTPQVVIPHAPNVHPPADELERGEGADMSLEQSAEPPRAGVSPAVGTSRSAEEPAHPGVALGVGSGEPSEHAAKRRSRVEIPETIASDSPPSFLKRPYPSCLISTAVRRSCDTRAKGG